MSRALKSLGVEHNVSDNSSVVLEAEKLILPGVGNFAIAMEWLKSAKLDNVIRHKVINEKAPILGICLGMQLFATFGEEGGGREGLNFIRGKTSYHRASQCGLPLPHIGWNDVKFNGIRIFESIPYNSCFYFVHSYEFIPTEPVEVAYSNYGVDFVAMVKKENIIGVQFHPEKSQGAGLRLLKNFCEGRF